MGPTVDLCPLGMLIKVLGVCVCVGVKVGLLYQAAQPDKPGVLDNHMFMCNIIICLLMNAKINSAYIPFIQHWILYGLSLRKLVVCFWLRHNVGALRKSK